MRLWELFGNLDKSSPLAPVGKEFLPHHDQISPVAQQNNVEKLIKPAPKV